MNDLLLALTLLTNTQVADSGRSCGDVAIVSANSRFLGQDGAVNRYALDITVANNGSSSQPPSMLQSVEIYQDATHVDQKGLPPLHAGQRATVTYQFTRSVQARANTTQFRVQLTGHDPHSETGSPCDESGQPVRATV